MTATASKTLYTPTFPEHTTDQDGKTIANLTYGERFYTVSQGRKRKIALSWNPVEIAKYYQIYAAKNINDSFAKIGESKTASFEDSVGSGSTFYYKVRAVNSKGETSDFSSIVHGTSLATPAINNIEITDTSATVFWYMGNVGIDSYAKNLVYEIHAFKGSEESVKTIKAWDELNQTIVESCQFENLSGNTNYEFRVDAYIASEQSEVESSPKVSKATLAQYTPVSPEFTATQGESINYVKLLITLPPMIQVQTKKASEAEKHDVDYPVCFEIQRKKSDETDYRTIVSTLYFDGTTTAPDADAYKTYTEGKTIEYQDPVQASALSVARGTKYDYRIISYIDTNFSTKNGYEFKSTIGSNPKTANTSTGWAAARPNFRVKNFSRTIDPNNSTKVASISLGFEASWTDLDKAKEYKFAIEQNKRADQNDTTGTDSWITDTNGNIILGSLDAVSSVTQYYDLSSNASAVEGIYRYRLYVFPAKYTDPDKIKGSNILDKVEAVNIISVSSDATVAVAELNAEGGWTNKIRLTWTVESGVTYSMSCERYDAATDTWVSHETITSTTLLKGQTEYDGVYDHAVPEGQKYRYQLFANTSSSNSVTASTLGTPVVSFTANSYEDIKVSWPQVIEAQEYTITLGTNGGFGNGVSFTIKKDGSAQNVPDGLTVDSALEDPTKPDTSNINLTIKQPYGYNDATLSGKEAELKVTALSEFDSQNQRKGVSAASKNVWTIGPAAVNLKATETYVLDKKSVTISWSKVEGAVGYAVYRLRPDMTGIVKSSGTEKKDATLDNYFVNAEGTSVTGTGASSDTVAITYDSNAETFTLTDKFKKKSNGDNAQYAVNQQYLALGLPFTYTVLPILETSATDTDSLDTSSWPLPCPAYSKLADIQKIGYTTGYGIALEASKAEYNNKVTLAWEVPQSAKDKGKTAFVWYRKKGSDDAWTATNANPGTANKCDFTPTDIASTVSYDDTVQALEYAVTYTDTMDMSEQKDATYVEYLKDDKININETVTKDEFKNVGYMFNLPAISYDAINASNEHYYETFKWHLYGYGNDRKVGNDIKSYTLTIKNKNIAAVDWPVFDYDANGSVTKYGSKSKDDGGYGYTWYNMTEETTPSESTVTVKFTPSGIDTSADTGTDYGLLKVQRDYKHYYTLTATRQNGLTTSREVVLYRKITKDEFAKGITLIIADSLYQAGITDGGSYATCSSEDGGQINYRHKGASKTVIWGTFSKDDPGTGENYTHQFKSGLPGDQTKAFTSGWTINIGKQEFRSAVDGHKVYYLTTGGSNLKVSHVSGLASYGGSLANRSSVEFTMGEKGHNGWTELSDGVKTSWTLSFKKDGVSICPSFSDATTFKTWFPLDIGGDYSSSVTTYTEGLPLYSGNWWFKKEL